MGWFLVPGFVKKCIALSLECKHQLGGKAGGACVSAQNEVHRQVAASADDDH